MKFKDFYFLALREEIEFDAIVNGEESEFTIVPSPLTPDGYKEFASVFDAEIDLIVPPPVPHTITVVEFKDADKKTASSIDLFISAQAGYVSATKYDKWFTDSSDGEYRVVCQKEQTELVSRGRFNYELKENGERIKSFYAWNDAEALEKTNF